MTDPADPYKSNVNPHKSVEEVYMDTHGPLGERWWMRAAEEHPWHLFVYGRFGGFGRLHGDMTPRSMCDEMKLPTDRKSIEMERHLPESAGNVCAQCLLWMHNTDTARKQKESKFKTYEPGFPNYDQCYLSCLEDVRRNGVLQKNRTGVDTLSTFGQWMEFTLPPPTEEKEGWITIPSFPVLTSKKISLTPLIGELLAFIGGKDNIKDFQANGCKWWDANEADPKWRERRAENFSHMTPEELDGYLGPIYGSMWRHWGADPHQRWNFAQVDQLADVITTIRDNPTSRRIVMTAWNPSYLDDMVLPPCHMFCQFYVNQTAGTLSMSMYQRSCDMFLGVPMNIASYALLLSLVGVVTGYKPHRFIHVLGDTHIYVNHLDQVEEQLKNFPTAPTAPPKCHIRKHASIDDYKKGDIVFSDYKPCGAIKAVMAV